jgi:hypothetical protein
MTTIDTKSEAFLNAGLEQDQNLLSFVRWSKGHCIEILNPKDLR